MELEFFEIFSKNPRIANFMKIRVLGAELFKANGRTDLAKLIVAHRKSVNAPEKRLVIA
jgi:hypothetical protein